MNEILLNLLDIHDSVYSTDPHEAYDDFNEIGHGNFGSVFSAISKRDNEMVAIKKMCIDTKQNKDRIGEIEKEINILRTLRHSNIVHLYEIYSEARCVWIVMEYCIGSVYDLISNSPEISEPHTSYIITCCLKGLEYLHSLNHIHRDIKSSNILITAIGVVKLGDFGSASIKTPANTFVGSPYWMAPEVIMAMEDGLYDTRIDIWSLGITCIEIAEKKPPLYHLNTMSALYHISENDPPQLLGDKWSSDFKNFTNSMLKKTPSERPSAETLLTFEFVKISYEPSFLLDILVECSENARVRDADAYKKFKKVLNETESVSPPASSPIVSQQATPNSTSITQELAELCDLNIHERLIDLDRAQLEDKLTTIKTIEDIKQEAHLHQDNSYFQLKDYQALRRANIRQIKLLEQKLDNEIVDFQRISVKLIDNIKLNSEKLLKGLKDKYEFDLDKMRKQKKDDIRKYHKTLIVPEKKNFFYTIKGFPKGPSKHGKVSSLSATNVTERQSISEISSSQNIIDKLEINYENRFAAMKLKFTHDYYHQLIQNRENLGKTEIDNIKKYEKLETSKVEQVFKNKKLHLEKLHLSETDNQDEYMKKKRDDMRKKHLAASNTAKKYKNYELQISKIYKDSVKTQEQQYKILLRQSLENAPKEQHEAIRKKLKAEKIQRFLSMKELMDKHVATFITQDRQRINDHQTKELEELDSKLNFELNSLKNYQNAQMHQLVSSYTKECAKMKEKFCTLLQETKTKIENDLKALHEEHETEAGKIHISHHLSDLKISDSSQTTPYSISSGSQDSSHRSSPCGTIDSKNSH